MMTDIKDRIKALQMG